jgi:hypothetical protein
MQDPNPQKASTAVRHVVDAFVKEMEKRRSADRSYGTVRVDPIEPIANGAKALIRMEGPRWGEAERQKTRVQLAALRNALSDPKTIRRVAEQTNGGLEAEAIVEQIRKTLVITGVLDSRLAISFVAPDPGYMWGLLNAVPRQKLELPEGLSTLDLDFVPARLRSSWYIFNCCEVTP